ncbi:MAG: ABC transporter permease [Bacillota bacterium]|nr:ABC transporter permease [Bacillota bacterium]
MLKSIKYVLSENFSNLYRIYSISKYEVLADIRDTRLGIFWNFVSPTINILTYWFVFGIVMNRNDVDGIAFFDWMIAGMVCWFFIRPCIVDGCNAIFQHSKMISKMKFPVSILPATVVMKELFNHLCLMIVVFIIFMLQGIMPDVHWLGLLYYCFCAVCFCIALSMCTSVLNMLARDTKKFVSSIMRLLLYMTPILWPLSRFEEFKWIQYIMKANPIYYVVAGYRDCFFYHLGFWAYRYRALCFWAITLVLFVIGSVLMNKFKSKFADLI